MASQFVRRVRTASGAVAVQVVTKRGGEVVGVDHVGSAHTDAELALLLQVAWERLHPGQGVLELGPVPQRVVSTSDVADWTSRPSGQDLLEQPTGAGGETGGRRPLVASGSRVVGTASLLLWRVLAEACPGS